MAIYVKDLFTLWEMHKEWACKENKYKANVIAAIYCSCFDDFMIAVRYGDKWDFSSFMGGWGDIKRSFIASFVRTEIKNWERLEWDKGSNPTL